MGYGAGLSLIRATAAGQRLEALYLFADLFINGGVPEVDVPIQTRVRVVLVFGGWVRVECARLWCVHSEPPSSVGRSPGAPLTLAGLNG